MNKIGAIVIATSLPMIVGASGCDSGPTASSVKNEQAQKAERAANSIQFTDNAEIDNIKARLELTANPGLLGFIILLNEMGQPVLYEGVKGKVTSGTKRLTKPYAWAHRDCGQYGCDQQISGPSDEGTFGTSGDYVFYWNVNGQYRQWNGKYLYSDKPFRLRIEPLVISGEPAANHSKENTP